MNSTENQIVLIEDPDQLHECAQMMTSTDPWKVLGFTTEQCEKALCDIEMRVTGVMQNGKVIAFLASLATGISFEPLIEYLCVDKSMRSQGLGTQLIKHFEEELFPNSKNLYMFVSDINPRAMSLYERLGYVKVGTWENYNIVGQTEFLMRKTRGVKLHT